MGTTDAMIVGVIAVCLILTAMISGAITLNRFGKTKGE